MTGRELTRIIEDRLLELNMNRGQFCRELGITSAAFSAWKNGSMPKPERIAQIEKCLGISFSDYEKSDETDELREMLRDRQDQHIMLTKLLPTPKSPVFSMGLGFLVRVRVPYGSPTK